MSALTPAMEFVMTLSSLQAQLLKRIDQHLSAHGISFTEMMVLYHLQQAPEQTMRRMDLAECVGLSASGVTRLLMPMEKMHLVQKEQNPRDARVSLVKLSEIGAKLFSEAFVSFEHSANASLQALDAKQLGKFQALTQRLS